MNNFEMLEQEIHDNGVRLITADFDFAPVDGLYMDGVIFLDKGLQTATERACVAAEELGHHETSSGNIIDLGDAGNRKQEYVARLRAYNKLIGLRGIVNGFQARCRSRYELATFLGVTEEFLQEALDCYKSKYGIMAEVDNYVIFFEPYLSVMERLN